MLNIMPDRRIVLTVIGAAVLGATGCAAGSKDAGKPGETAHTAPAVSSPISPEQLESFRSMLVGSWRTGGRDPATGEATGMWMHIAPVSVEGVENALYVEQCRGGEPSLPFRQAIFQPYLNRGKLRLRTIAFRARSVDGGPWALAWLVPEQFPQIDANDLIATLDLEFTPIAGGFEGRTPYPYPNADSGAVEMTSQMRVTKDRLVTCDAGYGPDGAVVWGSAGGLASADAMTWQHADPGFKVQKDDDGLVIITIDRPADGAQPVDGDTLFLDYAVWLADGTLVDSSRKNGRLMPVPYPIQEGRLMEGFVRGIAGVTEGSVLRLIVPPALGYGENPRGPIPGNSTLYFRVEVNTLQKPAPAEVEPDAGGQPGAGDGSGAHGGH